MKERMLSLALAAALALSLLSGCSGQTSAGSQSSGGSDVSASQPQGGQESQAISLVDQAGRTVTLDAPAQRIVSVYYLSSSLLIALGVQDKVVGIEMKADTREIYKRAAPEFLELPAVGSGKGINVEEIAALEPDLVILPVKLQESVAQLDALGIQSLVIDPETMDGFLTAMDLIGQAVGAQERAAQLGDYHRSVMEDVGTRCAQSQDKPTVYIAGSDFLSAAGGGMYQNDLIETAGGINAAASLEGGSWTDISAEELISWDPDRIYMVSYAGYTREEILQDSRFSALSAMAQDGLNFQVFPSMIEPWDYPTPSSVLGIYWLAAQLHPDIVSADEYITAAKDFYQTYFGIEVTTDDLMLDGMLMVDQAA